ncbi:MAG: sulfotransferase [Planctomycetota bacterium]
MNPWIGGRLLWERACRDARWATGTQPGRRIFGFGMGTSKTGSHSLAAMFARSYRAVHEAEPSGVAMLMRAQAKRGLTEAGVHRRLRARVARMNLELDVAPFHARFAEAYVALFGAARFVHLHRDVHSWFDSNVNQVVGRYTPWTFREMRRITYGTELASDPREGALIELGLRPLRSYLGAWAELNRGLLRSLPADRTLRVRTTELSGKVEALADFFGVDVDTLDARRAHSFSAKVKAGVLDRIDSDYYNAVADEVCGEVMGELYPEVRDSRDVGFHAEQ